MTPRKPTPAPGEKPVKKPSRRRGSRAGKIYWRERCWIYFKEKFLWLGGGLVSGVLYLAEWIHDNWQTIQPYLPLHLLLLLMLVVGALMGLAAGFSRTNEKIKRTKARDNSEKDPEE